LCALKVVVEQVTVRDKVHTRFVHGGKATVDHAVQFAAAFEGGYATLRISLALFWRVHPSLVACFAMDSVVMAAGQAGDHSVVARFPFAHRIVWVIVREDGVRIGECEQIHERVTCCDRLATEPESQCKSK
jgi:hypothetical protein